MATLSLFFSVPSGKLCPSSAHVHITCKCVGTPVLTSAKHSYMFTDSQMEKCNFAFSLNDLASNPCSLPLCLCGVVQCKTLYHLLLSLQYIPKDRVFSLCTFPYLSVPSLSVYLLPCCSCLISPISLCPFHSSQIAEQLMTLAYEHGINLFDHA